MASLPCTKLRWYHPAKHVSKLSPEKATNLPRGVLKQLEEPEKFLSTIQIGITLIGIVSGAYGGVAIADDLVPLFSLIPGAEAYARNLAMITTVVIITYLSLIIGELVPKSIALSNPERYATLFSPIMILLTKVSYPFVWFLSISTRLLNRTHRREERRTPDDTGRDQNDSPPKLRTGSDRQGRDGNAA